MSQTLRWLLTGLTALAIFSTPALSADFQKKGLVYQEIGLKRFRLDIFYPHTPPPKNGFPLIIWIHGGGWAIGNRSADFFFKDFTKSGFAVATVDYRSSLFAKFPAQIEDVTAATRWLFESSKELQFNPERVGAAGASAGGHLALLLGLAQNNRSVPWALRTSSADRIKAIAALYPPTDLIQVVLPKNRDRSNNLVSLLLGGPVTQLRQQAIEGSPVHYVNRNSPPVFLVHGKKDELVSFEQSQLFKRAMEARGANCQLIVYPEAAHGFKPNAATRQALTSFFQKALK